MMPTAIGSIPMTPTATAPLEQSAGPAGSIATLVRAANEPRSGLLHRLGNCLAPVAQRVVAAFAGIGNASGWCLRPALYDWTSLHAWALEGQEGEDRAEAVELMRAHCMDRHGLGALDLSNLGLRQLPPLPADLTSLICDNNALTELPPLPDGLRILLCRNNPLNGWLPSLPATLWRLDISDSPVTALPPLPAAMTWLVADNCGLTSVPSLWPAGLDTLSLQENEISAMGQLPTALQVADLRDNLLRELPLNWQQLRGRLNLDGNPLNSHTRRFLADFPRNLSELRITYSMDGPQAARGDARPLHEAVAAWYGADEASAAAQRWACFAGEVGAAEFALYLDRLAGTVNAIGPASTPAFRAHVSEWLSHLANEPALREHTLAIVAPGNERCEDRATLVFLLMTRLRVHHDVASGHYDGRPAALLEAMEGTRRLEELEQIALDKLRSMAVHDDVEVILAYPIGLRERLRLPIGVEAMRFGNVSDVSERDLDQAEARVRALGATFPQYLAQHASFHKVLERWAPERFAVAEAELAEAVEKGTYAAQVERRIEAAGPGLSDDPAATSQAGRAVLEELQEHVFGPLVRAYLGPVTR